MIKGQLLKLFYGRFAHNLRAILGYWPKDLALYKLAFRHSSAFPFRKKKGERNNERLEFLGDAVLDLIVAECLYYFFPEEDEGYLTKLRSKIVSRNNLNRVADTLGLPNLLISNLRGAQSQSIYGDALEALIGAFYIDHGLTRTQEFAMRTIILPFLDNPELQESTFNYKSEIIERFQSDKISFRFEVLERLGEQHNSTFIMGLFVDNTLVARGEGGSKKKGEEAAAKTYFEEKYSDAKG